MVQTPILSGLPQPPAASVRPPHRRRQPAANGGPAGGSSGQQQQPLQKPSPAQSSSKNRDSRDTRSFRSSSSIPTAAASYSSSNSHGSSSTGTAGRLVFGSVTSGGSGATVCPSSPSSVMELDQLVAVLNRLQTLIQAGKLAPELALASIQPFVEDWRSIGLALSSTSSSSSSSAAPSIVSSGNSSVSCLVPTSILQRPSPIPLIAAKLRTREAATTTNLFPPNDVDVKIIIDLSSSSSSSEYESGTSSDGDDDDADQHDHLALAVSALEIKPAETPRRPSSSWAEIVRRNHSQTQMSMVNSSSVGANAVSSSSAGTVDEKYANKVISDTLFTTSCLLNDHPVSSSSNLMTSPRIQLPKSQQASPVSRKANVAMPDLPGPLMSPASVSQIGICNSTWRESSLNAGLDYLKMLSQQTTFASHSATVMNNIRDLIMQDKSNISPAICDQIFGHLLPIINSGNCADNVVLAASLLMGDLCLRLSDDYLESIPTARIMRFLDKALDAMSSSSARQPYSINLACSLLHTFNALLFTLESATALQTKFRDLMLNLFQLTVDRSVISQLSQFTSLCTTSPDFELRTMIYIVDTCSAFVSYLVEKARFKKYSRHSKSILASIQFSDMVGLIGACGKISDALDLQRHERFPSFDSASINTFRIFNYIASDNVEIIARIFCGDRGGKLQASFVQFLEFTLKICTVTKSPQSAKSASLLNEAIVAIGYYVAAHPTLLASIRSGVYPSILQRLGYLPIDYFIRPKLVGILLPTLILCCSDPENFALLRMSVSPRHLARYMDEKNPKLTAHELPGRFSPRRRISDSTWTKMQEILAEF